MTSSHWRCLLHKKLPCAIAIKIVKKLFSKKVFYLIVKFDLSQISSSKHMIRFVPLSTNKDCVMQFSTKLTKRRCLTFFPTTLRTSFFRQTSFFPEADRYKKIKTYHYKIRYSISIRCKEKNSDSLKCVYYSFTV
jgi:hypothetical protein